MKAERKFAHHAADAHWSVARMLDRLYGLDTPPELHEFHLHECPECASRWSGLSARRAALLNEPGPAIAEDRLRAQRAAVFAQLDRPRPRGVWSLVPAAATALLLVMGIALQTPAPVAETQTASILSQSDRELFTEIAALVEEDMPRAAGAFRDLFDTDAGLEVH